MKDQLSGTEIAIIGMSGRFPGAENLEMFWRNLSEGVEGITFFTDEELIADGIGSKELENPNYVRASGVLKGIDFFDADLFGVTPREAEIMDPQQRIFLECAWEALEDSGYDPQRYGGRIGVYAGAGFSGYFIFNLMGRSDVISSLGTTQILISNDKDFLTSQVSYRLNLRGPSVCVQTACSTSLVAVHLACQSLIAGECDLALAGGITVRVPHHRGYLSGGIGAIDGHCRPFDADASGTVMSSGAGIVVLKRLEEALRDRDQIGAVIKGSAINSDGAGKVGFTAPSVAGQAAVIAAAQAVAGVRSETITYVEAHGTGTPLGDPIEVAALSQTFSDCRRGMQFCALGSVKGNIGHLDTASGVAGLIKTVLALRHNQLPPSLHFRRPNPNIDFAKSPFYVNERLQPWPRGVRPRRAGVSSFGVGGTNAHVVVEEAPSDIASSAKAASQLIILTAQNRTALRAMTDRLVQYCKSNPDLHLPDVAYTLQVGRRSLPYRRAIVAHTLEELCTRLTAVRDDAPCVAEEKVKIAFLFAGQANQYAGIGRELYRQELVFRDAVNHCCQLMNPELRVPVVEALRADLVSRQPESESVHESRFMQSAIFVFEYSLAKLWMSWGVEPAAMLGRGLGEYVAACLSGVLSLETALNLVEARGRLTHTQPADATLAVCLPEMQLQGFLNENLTLAAIDGPELCVISGTGRAIAEVEQHLAAAGHTAHRLPASHAFCFAATESMLDLFRSSVERADLKPPQIPYLSNLTGSWITAKQVTSPEYWVQHARSPVKFAAGLACLLEDPKVVLLETVPGQVLDRSAAQSIDKAKKQEDKGSGIPDCFGAASGNPFFENCTMEKMLESLGRLWESGASIRWSNVCDVEKRRRVGLPTYPFQRQRYWVDPVSEPIKHPSQAESDSQEQSKTMPHLAQYPRPAGAPPYRAPDGYIESQLVTLWEDMLGISPVGRFDDFFDFGGESLLAIQLISQIRDRLGKDCSLRLLLSNPTPAGLAGALFNDQSLAFRSLPGRSLVALQPLGARPKLFCIHPAGGTVTGYQDLSAALGQEQPFYALQSDGLDNDLCRDESIEALASFYLDAMRKIQPQGPYFLGGWSMGGIVAYEAAQQLLAAGEVVPRIFLFDVKAVERRENENSVVIDDIDIMLNLFGEQLSLSRDYLASLGPDGALLHLVQELKNARLVPLGFRPEQATRILAVYKRNIRAEARYSPQPYGGSIVLFQAADQAETPEYGLGWKRLALKGLQVYVTSGNHNTVLSAPGVLEIAENMSQFLR